MLENFKKNSLTNVELNQIKGGTNHHIVGQVVAYALNLGIDLGTKLEKAWDDWVL